VKNGFLQGSFGNVVVQRGPGCLRKRASRSQCLSRYVIATPRPEFGSTFLSSNYALSQAFSCFITGPLCVW
jgi:hypothetical protein